MKQKKEGFTGQAGQADKRPSEIGSSKLHGAGRLTQIDRNIKPVTVYPSPSGMGWEELGRLSVFDPDGGLSALLSELGVPYEKIDDSQKLSRGRSYFGCWAWGLGKIEEFGAGGAQGTDSEGCGIDTYYGTGFVSVAVFFRAYVE